MHGCCVHGTNTLWFVMHVMKLGRKDLFFPLARSNLACWDSYSCGNWPPGGPKGSRLNTNMHEITGTSFREIASEVIVLWVKPKLVWLTVNDDGDARAGRLHRVWRHVNRRDSMRSVAVYRRCMMAAAHNDKHNTHRRWVLQGRVHYGISKRGHEERSTWTAC